jgi:hypothetical protein
MIAAHNDHTGHRQQIEEPGVGSSELGHAVNGVVEGGSHHPYDDPDEAGKDDPFQEGSAVLPNGSSPALHREIGFDDLFSIHISDPSFSLLINFKNSIA